MKTKISFAAVAVVMLSVFNNAYAQVPCFNYAKNLGGTSTYSDYASGTATDAAGNIYVTGNIQSSPLSIGNTTLNTNSNDIFLAKYDPDGNVLWAVSAGGSDADYSNSICTDVFGNIYITGYTVGSSMTFGSITVTFTTFNGFYVAKYDASGNVLWVRTNSSAIGYNLVADNSGNVYVTGSFFVTMDFGSFSITSNSTDGDFFLIKYDAAGTALWARSGGGSLTDRGMSISIDASANIYVAGIFDYEISFGSFTLNNGDVFGVKYDSSGTAQWAIGVSTLDGIANPSITSDLAGNCYFASAFNNPSITIGNVTLPNNAYTGAGVFVSKLDPNGNVLWVDNPYTNCWFGFQAAPDNGSVIGQDGNFYLAVNTPTNQPAAIGNYTFVNSYEVGAAIVKYSPSGNVLWAKPVDALSSRTPGIILDNSNNLYVFGNYDNTRIVDLDGTALTNLDMFFAKLDQQNFSATTYYTDLDFDNAGSTTRMAMFCRSTPPTYYTTDNTDCNDDDYYIHSPNTFYVDADSDGFGSTTGVSFCQLELPPGYVSNNTDCDDNNPSLHTSFVFYVDADNDGYGSTASVVFCSSTLPPGYSTNNADCDDTNPSIIPYTYYVDADHDGYGSGIAYSCSPTPPPGFSTNNLDCNDSYDGAYPGAPELCDGIDDNCNGQIDEACIPTPALKFKKQYGDVGEDWTFSAERTTDGGYIMFGYTYDPLYIESDFYLVKININGDVMWTKTYGAGTSDGSETGFSVKQTSDGGYILVGSTSHAETGNIYIVKTDGNGNPQWSKEIGTGNYESAYSVEQTADGGYIIGGYTWGSTPFSDSNCYLVKTDSLGNITWTKAFGEENAREVIYVVHQTTDGGYIMGCGAKSDAGLIVKTDSEGNITWSTRLGHDAADPDGYYIRFNSFVETDDGYVIAGSTGVFFFATPPNAFLQDAFMTKTDFNGNVLWSKIFMSPGANRLDGFNKTSDGGFICAGFAYDFNSPDASAHNTNTLLFKTNSNGNVIWGKRYFGTDFEYCDAVLQTPDNGFALIGGVGSSALGRGNADVLLIKTDSLGNINCDEADITLTDTLVEIPEIPWTPTVDSFGTSVDVATEFGPMGSQFDVQPVVSASSNSPVCAGGTLNLSTHAGVGAANYSYSWTGPDGFTSTEQNPVVSNVNSNNAGDYYVEVTISSGCTISASASVTIVQPTIIFYHDADSDGYGNPNDTIMACAAPSGYVTDNTDCNDNDASVHSPVQYYVDADHDGFGSTATAMVCASTPPIGYSTDNTDCNDNDASVHSPVQYYVDADHDGFGSTATAMVCASTPPVGYSTDNTDCNDNDASVHSLAQYYVDADHDGFGSTATAMVCASSPPVGYSTDNTDCNDNDASVHAPVQYYVDADHDGFGSTATAMVCASTPPTGYSTNNTDCNDNNAAVHPEGAEVCSNGIDDNCNGQVDEGCCSISVSAGVDETLYFGYTPDQCVSKTAAITNGTAPYTYSWTLDRALLIDVITPTGDETMAGANSATVTVCLMDTAILCVSVTDANGCIANDCAVIYASDVRCFAGNNQKVTMCWNNNTICVNSAAVNAHLAQGAYLGSCTGQRLGTGTEGSDFTIYPNPGNGIFDLQMRSGNFTSIEIYDMLGNKVFNQLNSGSPAVNLRINLSQNADGVYFITVKDENNNLTTKKIVKM